MTVTTQESISAGPPAHSHSPDLGHELTQGFAGRYIRAKARLLVGKAGIKTSDRPDIEQELALALVERHSRFDPARGHWNAFVATVVERQAIKLLEARHTQKRLAGCRAASLNVSVTGPDGGRVEVSQLVAPKHASAISRNYSRPALDAFDLSSDIATVLAKLPWPVRQVCFRLQHEPMTEVARRLGRSRTALYRRVEQARLAFEHAGLRDFLRSGGQANRDSGS
jgi:DNA-directed RNA polymerase specialized sigma24 family protein